MFIEQYPESRLKPVPERAGGEAVVTGLRVSASAKINWFLEVTGRRDDGYHSLRTIMSRVSLYDYIMLSRSDKDAFTCNVSALDHEDNLAWRAFLELRKALGFSDCLSIELKKHIAVAAGLGGGSADAAAVINAVCRLLKLEVSMGQKAQIAFKLGADVPYCLRGGSAVCEGAGEMVYETDLPKRPVILAGAGYSCGSGEVFSAYDLLKSEDAPDMARTLAGLKGEIPLEADMFYNALEAVVLPKYPKIAALKDFFLSRGMPSAMSGSGGTVWALPPDEKRGAAAVSALKERGFNAILTHTCGLLPPAPGTPYAAL